VDGQDRSVPGAHYLHCTLAGVLRAKRWCVAARSLSRNPPLCSHLHRQDSLTSVIKILDFGSAVLHSRQLAGAEEGLRGAQAHGPTGCTPAFRSPESLEAGYRPSFEVCVCGGEGGGLHPLQQAAGALPVSCR
jgi:hypothetical protein